MDGKTEKAHIIKLIKKKKWADLRKSLAVWPPAEIAELLMSLDLSERVLLFRSLPRELAADVFAELDLQQQDFLLRELTTQEAGKLLTDLSPDDRTAFFEELPAQLTRRLFELLSPKDMREARQLLGYPEESVGRVMTPEFISVRPEWTVARALKYIRKKGKDSETINRIYVTDRHGKLLDDIPLRRLILANPREKIKNLMDHSFVSISAFSDREKAVEMIKKYDLIALPVVDSQGILLGIVTVDDLMDIEEEEVTEDFHKIAGVSVHKGGMDLIENIRDASVSLLFRRRIVWLILLVVVNIFSGAGIAYFEDVIIKAVTLVFFLPLLIDSGGNAGSQASTLMVRALATGDVKLSDWSRMLGKEFLVSGILGLTMGFAVSLIGIFRGGPMIAIVVSLAMICIVVVGSIIGMCLPFILTKFGRDPATASAPLITSIADIAGVLIYFSIATWLLGL